MNNFRVGLCQGRHEIPGISEYIFTEIPEKILTDPLKLEEIAQLFFEKHQYGSRITIWVTGLTVALIAALNILRQNGVEVTLMHYNRVTNTYFEQKVY